MAITSVAQEKIWFDKASHEKAERLHYENLAKKSRVSSSSDNFTGGSLAKEVAKARQHIKKGLQCVSSINTPCSTSNEEEYLKRIEAIEIKNKNLEASLEKVNETLAELLITVQHLRANQLCSPTTPHLAVCPPKPAAASQEDDEVDLFGSDSEGEDAEVARIRKERLEAYAAKKSKKPALIAKSNIIFDVKPWEDETDMKAMEAEVRKITADGLLWGAAKLVPLAFTIHKLQISCVIEDDKVSVDWLAEQIEAIEDLVQSVDIAAFNKV